MKLTAEKTKNIHYNITRLAQEKWGLNAKTTRILYESVIVPIMTYGSTAWYERMTKHNKKTLIGAQRSILIGMSRAFCTTSLDAIQVITACLPIDLAIEEKIAMWRLKTGRDIQIGDEYVTTYNVERKYRNRTRPIHPSERTNTLIKDEEVNESQQNSNPTTKYIARLRI